MWIKKLTENPATLILFGGKGGVGKTTCASSIGLYLSQYFKTLLFSTDPAHSLSDSFNNTGNAGLIDIKGADNLSIFEISAEEAFLRFKEKYGNEIKRILDTSTYLDNEDIESFLTLSIPGIDEVMGLKTIVDIMEEGKYEKYIVDTAPTGHALRLLALPELLDEWIKVMARMRWKYRYIVERFGGAYNPDESDAFLVDMKRAVKRIENILKDSERTEFIVVTIPEGMAILETERLIGNLRKFGIHVKRMIVNNVFEFRDCSFCYEKRKNQGNYLELIKERFDGLDITVVPMLAHEVRGLDTLRRFYELISGREEWK